MVKKNISNNFTINLKAVNCYKLELVIIYHPKFIMKLLKKSYQGNIDFYCEIDGTHLVYVFKQKFLIFLKIRIDKKIYENSYNII